MSPTNGTPKSTGPSQPQKSSGGPPPLPGESKSNANRRWLLPLLVVLVLVAVGVVIGLARHAARTANPPGPSAISPAESVSASAALPATNAASDSNAVASLPPPALKLQGIIYDPVRPRAIVDGQTVYLGSRVGNFLVKEISKDTLTLENTNGSRQTLFLGR